MELTKGAGRLARSAAFAGAAVALALAAHVGAGGRAPGPGMIALCTLVTAIVFMALTGRRLGRTTTMVSLGLLQVALHTTFSAATGASPTDHYASVCGHAHLLSHGVMPAGTPMHMGPLMLLTHVGATVALGMLLSHGEALLWSLSAYVGLRLPRPGPAPALWHTPAPRVGPATPVIAAVDPVPCRRGPPAGRFA